LIKNKRILVTGGAGFIGSNLINKLLDASNEVVAVDDFSHGKQNNLSSHKNLELVRGDVADAKLIKSKVEGVDLTIHAAARNQLRSVKEPVLDLQTNAGGTINVLSALIDHECCKVVYASSSSVYGSSQQIPQGEIHPLEPKSPYAISKLAGEYYCRIFSEVYGLKITVIRYFNVYGARDEIGVIPAFFTRLLDNSPPLIYGDGEQTRDYTYVDDAVEATLLLAEKMNWCYEVFNVGTGVETSANELADKMIRVCGKSGEIKPLHVNPDLPAKVGDVRRRCADITKIQQTIGWKPRISLDQGLLLRLNALKEEIGQ